MKTFKEAHEAAVRLQLSDLSEICDLLAAAGSQLDARASKASQAITECECAVGSHEALEAVEIALQRVTSLTGVLTKLAGLRDLFSDRRRAVLEGEAADSE